MDAICDIDLDDGVSVEPPWGAHGRDFTLGVVSFGSKFLLNILNSTEVRNGDSLYKHATERPTGVGLLTVCNHTR
jgi:monolysocardiolipin acyltransferase